MTTITRPVSSRDELIAEALYDAICDSNGAPLGHRDLAHHLAKRGLVIVEAARLIVEAARHDKLTATLQFVGSVLEPIIEGRSASLLPIGIGRALRNAVTKIREI